MKKTAVDLVAENVVLQAENYTLAKQLKFTNDLLDEVYDTIESYGKDPGENSQIFRELQALINRRLYGY